MSLKVKYIDIPEGVQEAAQVDSDAGQSFSVPNSVASGVADSPWATLESGGWALNGKGVLLADDPQEAGWWSAVRSGDDGRFTTPPVLMISFPAPYTATGLTFTFSPSTRQWCTEMQVAWYNGENLLAEVTAYPDKARWILKQQVESFDQIVVTLVATNNPGQFAKLQQIQIGQIAVFGTDELTMVQLVNEVDPTLCSLPVDTMKIELYDRMGYTFVPQENQRMELYRNDKLIAAHYITESSRKSQDYYTFSCQSAIGLLESDFMGGIYSDYPVDTLLGDILDGYAYTLDSALKSETITGYLPVCTRREALQQVAFALGAMVTTQNSSTICLKPLPSNGSLTFESSAVFYGGKVETAPGIAHFQVTAHRYSLSEDEETLIEIEKLEGTDILFTFDNPHHSYNITGGEIIDSGENWVKINANGESVTLTAKTYSHMTELHSCENNKATATERGNIMAVDKATLVHEGNVETVLGRLYNIGQLRQTLSQDVVIEEHKAGDYVSSANPWGMQTQGYITAMDNTLTPNGHTASVTILGKEIIAGQEGV